MIVGIVGLGLIGGSFAKAYSLAGEKVFAWLREVFALKRNLYGLVLLIMGNPECFCIRDFKFSL